MVDHLWLIGMMASGKSSVGRLVAASLHRRFVDVDDDVEASMGMSVREIFETSGETRFRNAEAAAIREAAARDEPCVVATGGGVVLRADNVASMRASGRVVWLRAGAVALAGRVAGEADERPLLAADASAQTFEVMLEQRGSMYAAAADHVVDTDGVDVAAVAEEIEAWWNALS